MNDTSENLASLEDATHVGLEAKNPVYLSWKEKEIRAALKFARGNSDRMVSQREIWKKYGLEY